MIAKCPCDHCGENIEFATEEFPSGGSVVCPHCNRSTTLLIPTPQSRIRKAEASSIPKTVLQTILQTLTLAVLIAIACILWVDHQSSRKTIEPFQSTPSTAVAAPAGIVKLEYAEFTFDKSLQSPAIVYYSYDANQYPVKGSSYPATDAAQALKVLSWDGWRLAWTDGNRYLVTRPEGDWKHYDFKIEEYKP